MLYLPCQQTSSKNQIKPINLTIILIILIYLLAYLLFGNLKHSLSSGA